MKIYNVTDPEFRPYGRVIEGCETGEILKVLREQTPIPEGTVYVPDFDPIRSLDRCSEFNLGTEDFILLLGRQQDIEDGMLDTATVKAFRAPAGVLVEVYATSLHYAPCHADPAKGFQVLVVLSEGTNLDIDTGAYAPLQEEETFLTAANKWLLAHEESSEAQGGARVGLKGVNIDIAADL